MREVVALIPAKEKSERVKNKNLKKVCKHPLLWWTIDYEKKSRFINEIYVSSDSLKILNYSQKKKSEDSKKTKEHFK